MVAAAATGLAQHARQASSGNRCVAMGANQQADHGPTFETATRGLDTSQLRIIARKPCRNITGALPLCRNPIRTPDAGDGEGKVSTVPLYVDRTSRRQVEAARKPNPLGRAPLFGRREKNIRVHVRVRSTSRLIVPKSV